MNSPIDEPRARESAVSPAQLGTPNTGAPRPSGPRSLADKFRVALRGLRRGIARDSNFRIHFLVAALVVVAGAVLRVSLVEWAVLALCIAVVLAAEMFNTSLELLSRAVTDRHDPDVEDALDTASASVLLVALGAAVVGILVLGARIWALVAGG